MPSASSIYLSSASLINTSSSASFCRRTECEDGGRTSASAGHPGSDRGNLGGAVRADGVIISAS